VGIWLDLDWGLKRELEVYAGVRKYADEAGWVCTLDPALERSLRPGPGGIAYDGVLGRVTKPMADAARKAGVPVVNTWLNSPQQGIPSVFLDFDASGGMAAEHLLDRGFRSFGYLGFRVMKDTRRQLRGFRAVLAREGFRCLVYRFPHALLVRRSVPGWERFVAGLNQWIEAWQPPIGIFVCEDLYCRFLIDACRLKGLRVPGDVAIIGSGNETEICAFPSPSLTSIDQGHSQKGYRAAALLDRLMDGEAAPGEPELVAPAELVLRQSTDVFATEDPLVARALRFMAGNCHTAVPVAAVAAAVATTRRTLERRFRASVGRSIAEEMIRLRLNRAKRHIVETDAPLKEVALSSGFLTANHFTKAFTRIVGTPPTRFREERQQVFMKRG
jgi:LacI family transcriptional regulator